MANTWESLQMTITKNNSTKVAHYETDTANIVDFEEASNNLINAALTAFSKDTNLTGITNIQNLRTPNTINISSGGGIYLRNPNNYDIVNGHLYFLEDDQTLKLFAGTQEAGDGNHGTGAGIILEKIPNDASGKFKIVAAKNATTRIVLEGDPQTEKLTWGGKELLTKDLLTSSDFKTTILNMIYPVGSVIYTTKSSIPTALKNLGGTWTQIAKGRVIMGVGEGTDKNNTKFTAKLGESGDNVGEYSHKLVTNELAKHGHGTGGTFTTSAAGEHVHSRGDMEITGFHGAWNFNETGGAFFKRTDLSENIRSGDWSSTGLGFEASRAWTGYTSVPLSNDKKHKEIANHTHTVSISLSETGGNGYHNNIPPYYGLYVWERTA